jgi:hypothetical protein
MQDYCSFPPYNPESVPAGRFSAALRKRPGGSLPSAGSRAWKAVRERREERLRNTLDRGARGISTGDIGHWLERVRGEYRDMPGLSLTERQAQRLWGLEPADCRAVLDVLIATGFLRRTNEGGYVRTGRS